MILITPRSNHNKISLPTIQVENSDVTSSESARNIGVMFDANMSIATQITTMCRSAWYQLRNIREVRHSLMTEATIRLVCALVFSRIDITLAVWGAWLLVVEASTGPEFRCKAGDKMYMIRSHYTHPPRTALAAGQAANSVQTACYHLQGPTWECIILPERDVTAISIYTHTAL